MNTLDIQFFSLGDLNGGIEMKFEDNDIRTAVELLRVFGAEYDHENAACTVPYEQQYTKELKERIDAFVLKHKDANKSVQQFKKMQSKLKENEWFYFFPNQEINNELEMRMCARLDELNGTVDTERDKKIDELFSDIKANYEWSSPNIDKKGKVKIGEGSKEKRVCRFCGKSTPEVTFKNEAHAISEALGNKQVILNEECDDCNEEFDKNIERDFIDYHDLTRTVFGIPSKSGKIPKMKGKDYELFGNKEDGNISIKIPENRVEENPDGPPKSITLETNNKVSHQNIYKALCKYALSIVDAKHIPHFKKTIDWLRDNFKTDKLPKVGVANDYNLFAEKPVMDIFVRSNDNYDLPHMVGTFRFAHHIYVFIVPFSSEDKKDFLNNDDYSNFLKCFKHISPIRGIKYLDFSDSTKRTIKYNINFVQQGN
jgi:hypothetical protein